jgi:AraC-like DNA-binding protein
MASAACRLSHVRFSFFAIVAGGCVIRDRGGLIPVGLVGEIRRTVAGARLHIDHHHADIEFDLVVRGSGSYTLRDITYELRPGTLMWLGPEQQHRLVRSPSLEMWVVTLRPELIPQEWIAEIVGHPSRVLPGQIAQDSDEIATYNAGIRYVVMRAHRASQSSPSAQIKPMHPAVARALLLLRESGAALSLSQLAEASGIAAPYLSRLLVEHTNRSFVDWRNHIRLERFMTQYRAGDNLLNAALDAGFGSYARFHHVFTDVIGCTPSDWVRQAAPNVMADSDAAGPSLTTNSGIPVAAHLSLRQRWTRLVPLVSPLVGQVLGGAFLDHMVSAKSGDFVDPRLRELPDHEGISAADVGRLVTSLQGVDSILADDFGLLIETHDFWRAFAGVVEPFGQSPGSLLDAVTAFTILVWIAGASAADPGLEEVRATGRQVAVALAGVLPKLDPARARDLHTALLCHFVVLHHALQTMRASGDPRAASQFGEAARSCARHAFGNEMAGIKFTRKGFVRRV